MQTPDIIELLKAGVHFGHKTNKWHPSMKSYIWGARKAIHIINLKEAQRSLNRALDYLQEIIAKKGTILFVGFKKEKRNKIKETAESVGMPYITEKWVGGTLTNWPVVKKQVLKLRKKREEKETGEWLKYTKKEQLILERELQKLEKLYQGIVTLDQLPEALFIVDCKKNKTALQEAKTKQVPVVALADTNIDIRKIDYPIAWNDDAVKAVDLILNLVRDAILEAKEKSAAKEKEQTLGESSESKS